jgi:hypothetical protein
MVSLSSRRRESERGKIPLLCIRIVLVPVLIASVFGWYTYYVATSTAIATTLSTAVSSATTTSSASTVVIGYAVSVTGCGSDPLSEGAAVLKHSIHLAHAQSGKYSYQIYALYHPHAAACVSDLADLGYALLERTTPVAVADIRGEFLRTHIEKNGCCGEKELIKLEAYTLTQHPVVVHLDLDVLVLQPLDSLFDVMINGNGRDSAAQNTRIAVQWPEKPFPDKPNAFFTRDCKSPRRW